MNKTSYLILFLLLFQHFWAVSQDVSGSTIPYIQNYDNKDYNTPENQTWAVLQDQRGVMYFGNNYGILEFDGNNWRLIEISNKSAVRSLAIDSTGRVFVGAVGEFGYLQADSTGSIQYVSLLVKIPEEEINFMDVWEIFIINESVIVKTSGKIFLIKENKTIVFKSINGFHVSFFVNNEFFVKERETGLLKLIDDSLQLVPNSDQFVNESLHIMLPYEEDKILIATRERGIFIYNPIKKNIKFSKPEGFKEIDNFLIKNQVYYGAKINNEQFILGTSQNGLIIIDKSGNILQHFNKDIGLLDIKTLSVYVDPQKNIWAGLNNGISYIVMNSPITLSDEKDGLFGSAYTAIIHKGRLYVATSVGLFRKDPQNNFKALENTKGQGWCLTEINGELFFGHAEGVFIIKDNVAKKIVTNVKTIWNLNKLKHKPYILAGHNKGLILLEFKNGNWVLKHNIRGFDKSSHIVQEDDNGNIWISHRFNEVCRLKLNQTLDSVIELNFYNSNHGLPQDNYNFVFKIKEANQNSRILFGTEKGIYKFNPETNRFVPDEIFNKLFGEEKLIDKFVQDANGNIYFQHGGEKGVLLFQTDSTYILKKTPFLKFKGLYIENISVIDTTTILFCSKDGIVHYNSSIMPDFDISYPVLIRQVLANGKIIFNGTKTNGRIIELPYKKYVIQLSYSALYYEDHNKTQYSYLLKGYDDQWSEWSLKTEKEYTNLPEGSYTFNVKAKNVYEKESTIAHYQFEILPPWYRTLLAYIVYFVIILSFIRLYVLLHTRRLKASNIRLEELVKERTSKIELQKEELITQANELQKLSIVASETNNAIIIMNANADFQWFNNAFNRLFGYSGEEYKKKFGNNLMVASGNPEIKELIAKCISTKQAIDYTAKNITKSGKEIWVHTTLSPVMNNKGEITNLIAVDSDITIIKEAEALIQEQNHEIQEKNVELEQQKEELQITLENLKQTQQQLVESKKMASLGNLVAGVAHEINTPVGVGIAASSTLVKKSKQIVELFETKKMTINDLKSYIGSTKMASELILNNLKRTGELVKSFKQVSVDQSTENQRQFNLKSYIEDVIRSLHPKLKKTSIQVEIVCDKDIELNSYPGVFAQIITNLVINSLTHGFKIDEKGEINISAMVDNNKLKIEYSDNGKGISKDILPKIFDPFYTTNKQKGTGLGLNIVYNLITQKLNGTIKCTSQINKGVIFTIMLAINK